MGVGEVRGGGIRLVNVKPADYSSLLNSVVTFEVTSLRYMPPGAKRCADKAQGSHHRSPYVDFLNGPQQ